MKNATLFLLLISLFAWTSCDDDDTCLPVMTDSDANLTQFVGLWYEIASLPQFFSAGCSCTTAEYTIDPNGNGVIVNNDCLLFGGIPNSITGLATQPDPNDFTKLKVSFPNIPGAGDYWILEFADDGSYMLVGNPDRDNLFILSRTPTLDNTIYSDLLSIAEDMCFDVDSVRFTDQSCNS